MNEEEQGNMMMINIVQKEKRLLTAWISPALSARCPMLGVIMAGHGPFSGSQLLPVLSQGNGGGRRTEAGCVCCVDSGQWAGVDS